MHNSARTFIAPWYLFGWVLHVRLGTKAPEIYRLFGRTALLPSLRRLWQAVVIRNITAFALLLAAFELVTDILILSKGVWVRIGLLGGITFNLFLAALGLGSPSPNVTREFVVNRLPNLLFAAAQIPLLRFHFDRSILSVSEIWIGVVSDRPRSWMRRCCSPIKHWDADARQQSMIMRVGSSRGGPHTHVGEL